MILITRKSCEIYRSVYQDLKGKPMKKIKNPKLIHDQKEILAVIDNNLHFLEKLESVVQQISESCEEIYEEGHYEIGSFVRHVIDFYRVFITYLTSNEEVLDYRVRNIVSADQVRTNKAIETNPGTGVHAIQEIKKEFERMKFNIPEDVLFQKVNVTAQGDEIITPTTVVSELFVLPDHLIHHFATMAVMAIFKQ